MVKMSKKIEKYVICLLKQYSNALMLKVLKIGRVWGEMLLVEHSIDSMLD